jgi:predicted ATPase
MLTRLKVSGFKNLVDVDVRFGPFTCIAGANGVGKSNLFDAIRFLSAIADRPLIEAALSVRDEGGRTADVRSLFHCVGDQYTSEMSFEAEMIVPDEDVDDLGQKASASITFLRYSLILAYRNKDDSLRSLGSLEIHKEELVHINIGDATKNLLFPHKPTWRKSAVKGRRTSKFISTDYNKEGDLVIELHQDGSKGRPLSRLAANLPRTVLSVANAAESPTALLARREMQSWRLLQLEPSSLRKPDEFTAPTRLGADGSHLAATLYYLARSKNNQMNGASNDEVAAQVYSEVTNRLSELIDDVRDVWVDRDEKRQLITLQVTGRDGTSHPARALSDGTLRFLALAVLVLEPEAQGLFCLEEPENGIHPERIPAILRLLQDIATDVDEPVGLDNPLRQVIINTHSPAVVMQVPDDSLLVAELKEMVRSGQRFKRVSFGCLPNTWRQKAREEVNIVPKNKLLAYLNPVVINPSEPDGNGNLASHEQLKPTQPKKTRVVDRDDLQPLIPGFPDELA